MEEKRAEKAQGILLIEIPNSYLKPHMNGRDNRFYRRHNFQALPMTEMDVLALILHTQPISSSYFL